jgi:membrane protein
MWRLLKGTFSAFIADGALSQGAAIAYYTIFSIAPVLVIAIAIAGLAFGQDAAQGAIVGQLGGLMGRQSAEALQTMIQSASNHKSGVLATIIGVGTLLATASGVFGQMQTALNQIWKAKPRETGMSRLVRARIASLGLVVTLGFLLMVSLVISAILSTLDHYLNGLLPGAHILMMAVNFVISLALIAVLFGAIYKVLPDKPIGWRDVTVGAIATAFLFTVGKTLIGLYLGHSNAASSYGGAGAFVIILLWIYYSSQIFLLGAEFTRVYAETHGSHAPGGENTAVSPPGRAAPMAAEPPRRPFASLPRRAAHVQLAQTNPSWPSRSTLVLNAVGAVLTAAGLTAAYRAADRDRGARRAPERSS